MKLKKEIKNEEHKTTEELKKGSFIDAWINAFNGIIYATTTQGNIRKQELSFLLYLLPYRKEKLY